MNPNKSMIPIPLDSEPGLMVEASQTSVPGLYVYQWPAEAKWQPDTCFSWQIAHASGHIIASAVYEDDAWEGVKRIACLEYDWTVSPDQLRQTIDTKDLYARLAITGCEHPRLSLCAIPVPDRPRVP